MQRDSRIFVAGETGMIGSAVCRELERKGYHNRITKPHKELDLCDQAATQQFFREAKPDYVFMCAAMVGGVYANDNYMADYAMVNMQMACNVLSAAHEGGVKKLLYLGTPCFYPRECPQPIKEEYAFLAPFEPTNEGYAIAKLFGARQCDYYRKQYGDNFFACVPGNSYGPGDNFDAERGHVISSLIMRFHEAKLRGDKVVSVWGTGTPRREFEYVDDVASGMVFLMENYDDGGMINMSPGYDYSISDIAEAVKKTVGFPGELVYDTTKPDGMPKRILDSSRMEALGWKPKTHLDDGLKATYEWYLSNRDSLEAAQ